MRNTHRKQLDRRFQPKSVGVVVVGGPAAPSPYPVQEAVSDVQRGQDRVAQPRQVRPGIGPEWHAEGERRQRLRGDALAPLPAPELALDALHRPEGALPHQEVEEAHDRLGVEVGVVERDELRLRRRRDRGQGLERRPPFGQLDYLLPTRYRDASTRLSAPLESATAPETSLLRHSLASSALPARSRDRRRLNWCSPIAENVKRHSDARPGILRGREPAGQLGGPPVVGPGQGAVHLAHDGVAVRPEGPGHDLPAVRDAARPGHASEPVRSAVARVDRTDLGLPVEVDGEEHHRPPRVASPAPLHGRRLHDLHTHSSSSASVVPRDHGGRDAVLVAARHGSDRHDGRNLRQVVTRQDGQGEDVDPRQRRPPAAPRLRDDEAPVPDRQARDVRSAFLAAALGLDVPTQVGQQQRAGPVGEAVVHDGHGPDAPLPREEPHGPAAHPDGVHVR
ncbi:hypothetical protein THAOC_34144, partial [Thalassiosira oceanica]